MPEVQTLREAQPSSGRVASRAARPYEAPADVGMRGAYWKRVTQAIGSGTSTGRALDSLELAANTVRAIAEAAVSPPSRRRRTVTDLKTTIRAAAVSLTVLLPFTATPQPIPSPYGAPIGAEAARKAAAAALAEARKNGWTVAVAVVDPGGVLVHFERIDSTQNGSSEVAIEKARTSAAFKRPSKVIEDVVASGKLNYLRLTGTIPIEGAYPIVIDGKVVGAIGVSGATSVQDGVCAKAGADAAAAK